MSHSRLKISIFCILISFLGKSVAVHFNVSCIFKVCERFHIRNLHLLDFAYGGGSSEFLPNTIDEFSNRGIRIAGHQMSDGKLQLKNLSRGLHALNTAYLLFNLDPAFPLQSLSFQDEFGTSPSLFIFSFVAIRGGFTAQETLQHALAKVDLKYDSRAYAMFQSAPRTFFEVYRVSSSRKITIRQEDTLSRETWKSLPLTDAKSSLTKSRSNMQGVKITGLVASISTDMEADFDDWTKAYIMIWKNIALNLNFTFSIKDVDRDFLPEASWGSMLEELNKGRAEVSLSPIIMLPSTAKKTDFTAPVHSVSFSVLMRATASERIRWTNFLLPFHSSLWMCILAGILVLTTVLALFWKTEFEKRHNTKLSFIEIFSEAFVCIHGAACMQGHPDPPNYYSARAIHLSALASAVVVMATYSGSVTAFLTVRVDNRPFSEFDDVLKSVRFRPFTIEKSPESTFFEESQHPTLKKFRSKGAPSTVPNLAAAMQIACSKNVSLSAPWTKKIPAFVVANIWVDRLLDLAPCTLTEYPLSMHPLWLAFPIAPKLPYKRILDNRRMFEVGAIHRFEAEIRKSARMRREYKEVLMNQGKKSENILSMNILDFTPLAALLGIGAAASLLIFIFEFVVYYLL